MPGKQHPALMKLRAVGLFAALLASLVGCTQRELDRSKAVTLLTERNEESLNAACQVSPRLRMKPEFRSLAQASICEAVVIVTGVRNVSETEAIAEAEVVYRPQSTEVRKWLEAFEALEQRLTSVTPARRSTMLGYNWEWTDPSDGETFTAYGIGVHPRKDVRHTKEWEELESLRARVQAFAESEEIRESIGEPRFQLYDDGWRLVS